MEQTKRKRDTHIDRQIRTQMCVREREKERKERELKMIVSGVYDYIPFSLSLSISLISLLLPVKLALFIYSLFVGMFFFICRYGFFLLCLYSLWSCFYCCSFPFFVCLCVSKFSDCLSLWTSFVSLLLSFLFLFSFTLNFYLPFYLCVFQTYIFLRQKDLFNAKNHLQNLFQMFLSKILKKKNYILRM